MRCSIAMPNSPSWPPCSSAHARATAARCSSRGPPVSARRRCWTPPARSWRLASRSCADVEARSSASSASGSSRAVRALAARRAGGQPGAAGCRARRARPRAVFGEARPGRGRRRIGGLRPVLAARRDRRGAARPAGRRRPALVRSLVAALARVSRAPDRRAPRGAAGGEPARARRTSPARPGSSRRSRASRVRRPRAAEPGVDARADRAGLDAEPGSWRSRARAMPRPAAIRWLLRELLESARDAGLSPDGDSIPHDRRARGRPPAHRGARRGSRGSSAPAGSSPAPWRCSAMAASSATRASSHASTATPRLRSLPALIAVGVLGRPPAAGVRASAAADGRLSRYPGARCAPPSTDARPRCSPCADAGAETVAHHLLAPSRWARRGRSRALRELARTRARARRARSRRPRTCAARSRSGPSRSVRAELLRALGNALVRQGDPEALGRC